MKRFSPILIMLLLVGSCIPLGLVSASGESTTISTFTGGFASKEINLQGGITDNSSTIEIPRNVTFNAASFDIEIDSTDGSPGQVWVDVNEDGVFEWEFTGTGYGNIGHQNQFYDGNEWAVIAANSGTTTSPGILLPSSSNLQSSNLNISFSPSASGGFYAIGDFQEVSESDIDGDGLPEPIFLSEINPVNNSTSFHWADWTASNGIVMSSPVYTCDNATSLSTGDVNGDGNEDVVTFSTISSQACVHIMNSTGFDPVINVTITSGLIDSELGDVNRDGSDDIVSIHSMGVLSFMMWNNASWGLTTAITETLSPNGSQGVPATLISVHVEDFFSNGEDSVLVKDLMGHWTNWNLTSNYWAGPLTTFDNIQQNEIIYDLDNDGDLDLIGSNDQGYALQVNNGTQWDATTFQSQVDLLNSTIVDFNNDGVLDLLTPSPGVSDGSNLTLEGEISYRSINATSVGSTSLSVLEPWSIPTSITSMDMDGDGVVEQIISAGEGILGVFISGWHNIELDADGDGNLEMSRFGYAGDSSNGLDPLLMFDDANGLRDDIVPIMGALPFTTDAYGISMVNYSMDIESNGIGEFNLTSLDFGYDCTFFVESNPHASANLTNVINQGMTGGVGTYSLTIPVNSTDAGDITLTNIIATHQPGAPNLALPTTPSLTLIGATSERIDLGWNDLLDFGTDLIRFEVYRLESANETISLTDVYSESMANITMDTEITVGSTYWYAVRSVHIYGITSNLSNIVEVTVPYPAPPGVVSGVTVSDIDADSGGALEITWEHTTEVADHYEIYLETSDFSTIDGLTSFSTVLLSQQTTIITGLTDGQGYWATVVAVDQYGNTTTTVSAVGPTYPRNDIPNAVNLQINVSSEISLGSPFLLEVTALVDQLPATPTGTISVVMDTNNGAHLIGTSWDAIDLTDFAELGIFTTDVSGEVTFWANYSGHIGDDQNRPIASASTSTTSIVNVGAILAAEQSTYELDWDNETDVRVNLTAINPAQSSLLEGATIVWTAYNNTTISSGSEQINNGFSQFLVNLPGGGTLFVNLTGPSWIDVQSDSLEITLVPYGSLEEENETEENETNNTPWTPTSMEDLEVDCGDVVIDPSTDQEIDCTITNPNNYTIDVSLEADGWSNWVDYIEFNPSPGQSEFSLEQFASSTIEIRVDIVQNLSNEGLTYGKIEIDLRQGPSDYMTPGDKPLTIEIQWSLKGEEPVDEPEPEQNNTGQTTTTSNDSSSNTMLYLGGFGAFAVICLIVFIVLRIKNNDLDEWNEEDLDLEPELEDDRISKPLPLGVALDDFEDKTIFDETPDKPDFINEFDTDDEYEEEYEEETEEEYEEVAEEDSGITVDEHGTEWYEDEIGVWWYRDEGQEDWSEFVE